MMGFHEKDEFHRDSHVADDGLAANDLRESGETSMSRQ